MSSVCVIAAATVQTTILVVSGIIASELSHPPQNRDPSRVELVMHAANAPFIRLPPVNATTNQPPAALEIGAANELAAANLAIEIDGAERADASPVEANESAAIAAASMLANAAVESELKSSKKSQRIAARKKERQSAVAELEALSAPTGITDGVGTARDNPSALTAAFQSAMPAKVQPVRKRLAHKHINAGELVRMQLLNLI